MQNSLVKGVFFSISLFFFIKCSSSEEEPKKDIKDLFKYLKEEDKKVEGKKKDLKSVSEEPKYLESRIPKIFPNSQTDRKENDKSLKKLSSINLDSYDKKNPIVKKLEKQKDLLKKNSIPLYIKKLPHLANSCFSNSLLSALVTLFVENYGLEEIKTWKKDKSYKPKKKANIGIVNAFVNLILELYDKNNTSYEVKRKTLQNLTDKIGIKAPQFLRGAPEDSHDYFMFIIDSLNEVLDVGTLSKKLVSSQDRVAISQIKEFENIHLISEIKEKIKKRLNKQYPFHKNLGGLFLNVVQCTKCNKYSLKLEPFGSRLILSKDNNRLLSSLEQCFKFHNSKELVDGYFCSNCKERLFATKHLETILWPKILAIKFVRFHLNKDTGINEKATHTIAYGKYFTPPTSKFQKEKIKYELRGVVMHSGGHYTSYTYDKTTNKWIYFDDVDPNTPKIVDEKKVVNHPDASILFYQQVK